MKIAINPVPVLAKLNYMIVDWVHDGVEVNYFA